MLRTNEDLKVVVPRIQNNMKFTFSIDCPTSPYNWSLNPPNAHLDIVSSYHLIPCVEGSISNPCTWENIGQLLKLSMNKILDISLPYIPGKTIDQDQFQLQQQLLKKKPMARYILSNGKLMGVRINSSDLSERFRKKIILKDIPTQISQQMPYRNLNHYQKKEQYSVGEFYLIFQQKTKVAVLFEQQLIKNFQLLKEHYALGCEVFAVVDTLTVKKKDPQKEQLSQQLYQFCKEYKVVVLYTGFRMAISPFDIFMTHPYIATSKECLVVESCLDKNSNGNICRLTVDLFKIKQEKKYEDWRAEGININIRGISLNQRWRNLSENNIGRKVTQPIIRSDIRLCSIFQQPIRQFMFRPETLLYIWYLYHSINLTNPFVIGLPFSKKTHALAVILKEIFQLNKNTISEFSQLLILYNFQSSKIQDVLSLKFPTITFSNIDQLLSKKEGLVFYTQDEAQLSLLVERQQGRGKIIDQSEEKMFNKNVDISLSSALNGPPFLIASLDLFDNIPQSQFERNYQFRKSRNSNQKLRQICRDISKKNWKNLEQLYVFLLKNKLQSNELKYVLTQGIKSQLIKDMKPTSIHSFFITNTPDKIWDTFGDIEINIKSSNIMKVPEQNQQLKVSNKEQPQTAKQKQQTIKTIRKKQEQKRLKLNKQTCHKCYIPLKNQLGEKCKKCKSFICFDCKSTHIRLDDQIQNHLQIDEKYCLVCMELCDCYKCKNKKLQQIHRNQLVNNGIDSVIKKDLTSCAKCEIVNSFQQPNKPIYYKCNICQNEQCYYCIRREIENDEISLKNMINEGWKCKKCSLAIKAGQKMLETVEEEYQRIKKQKQKRQRQKEQQLKSAEEGKFTMINDQDYIYQKPEEIKKNTEKNANQQKREKYTNQYEKVNEYGTKNDKDYLNKDNYSFGNQDNDQKQDKRQRSRSRQKYRNQSTFQKPQGNYKKQYSNNNNKWKHNNKNGDNNNYQKRFQKKNNNNYGDKDEAKGLWSNNQDNNPNSNRYNSNNNKKNQQQKEKNNNNHYNNNRILNQKGYNQVEEQIDY